MRSLALEAAREQRADEERATARQRAADRIATDVEKLRAFVLATPCDQCPGRPCLHFADALELLETSELADAIERWVARMDEEAPLL